MEFIYLVVLAGVILLALLGAVHSFNDGRKKQKMREGEGERVRRRFLREEGRAIENIDMTGEPLPVATGVYQRTLNSQLRIGDHSSATRAGNSDIRFGTPMFVHAPSPAMARTYTTQPSLEPPQGVPTFKPRDLPKPDSAPARGATPSGGSLYPTIRAAQAAGKDDSFSGVAQL